VDRILSAGLAKETDKQGLKLRPIPNLALPNCKNTPAFGPKAGFVFGVPLSIALQLRLPKF
jgi:hypothetical protein